MTLRFHRQLYDGKAVDSAVKQFEGFGTFALSEEPDYWVVAIGGAAGEELAELAGELGNFALGLTIQQRG